MARTNSQNEIISRVISDEFKAAIELIESICTDAKSAIVSLPHKNEAGESVINRDNLNMRRISERLESAADNLKIFNY